MIDKLLLDHVGLPCVLVLAVHLGNFFSWVSQGGHSEQLLFFALFYQSTPSCLKVVGGWCGVVVAHVILVSAQGPNPSLFFFGGTFIQFGGLFGQGLGLGLGPGLDNSRLYTFIPQLPFDNSSDTSLVAFSIPCP